MEDEGCKLILACLRWHGRDVGEDGVRDDLRLVSIAVRGTSSMTSSDACAKLSSAHIGFDCTVPARDKEWVRRHGVRGAAAAGGLEAKVRTGGRAVGRCPASCSG